MTKAAEQCRLFIISEFPGTPVSRFACRNTASGGISQHSAFGSPGIDSNAIDVFGPGKSARADDQAWIQAIVDTIKADGEQKWSIRKILFKDGGAHENHAHIDFLPMITIKKWCGKPQTPTWRLSNGKIVTTRDPQPENGLYDGSGAQPIPPPDIPGEEDMQEYIRAQQENLNAAGFTDQDGEQLVVDGVYGPKTQHAEGQRDLAASATNS
jgi:hypothetical protein